jgi:hypothetical protein
MLFLYAVVFFNIIPIQCIKELNFALFYVISITITRGYISNLYVELVTMLWECVSIISYSIWVDQFVVIMELKLLLHTHAHGHNWILSWVTWIWIYYLHISNWKVNGKLINTPIKTVILRKRKNTYHYSAVDFSIATWTTRFILKLSEWKWGHRML